MLVLSRKIGEKVRIGNDVMLEIVKIQGNRVTLGFSAPHEVPIVRDELESKERKERND